MSIGLFEKDTIMSLHPKYLRMKTQAEVRGQTLREKIFINPVKKASTTGVTKLSVMSKQDHVLI